MRANLPLMMFWSALTLSPNLYKKQILKISILFHQQRISALQTLSWRAKNRSEKLRKVFGNSDLSKYDYVLLDCPPSLNVLTVNALIAAHALIIPLQSEFFALEGLSQLLMSVREVRDLGNPDLRIEGVVLTMYDARNRLSLQVEEDARENLGELVFTTVIPRNVRISEAPSFAMPVLSYDSRSKGAEAYRALAQEILARR